jgi:hypothetical protein
VHVVEQRVKLPVNSVGEMAGTQPAANRFKLRRVVDQARRAAAEAAKASLSRLPAVPLGRPPDFWSAPPQGGVAAR